MIVRRRGAGAVDERRLSRWAGGVDCQFAGGKVSQGVGEAGWGYVWGGVRGHCRWVQGGQWACDGGRGLEGVEGRDQQTLPATADVEGRDAVEDTGGVWMWVRLRGLVCAKYRIRASRVVV